MKLLIVDDEPLVRIGVKSILQAQDEKYELIAEAGDGEAALKLVREIEPDVVLVDIRMPVMNGLDFIAAAQKDLPNGKFIVLSCLNEFEYAKTAMKLGVTDYIIKSSIDTGELINILDRHSEEIEARKKLDDASQREKHRNYVNRQAAVKDFFNNLVAGLVGDAELNNALESLGVAIPTGSSIYLMDICIDHYRELISKQPPKEYSLLKSAVCSICQEVLEKYCSGYVFDKNDQEITAVLFLDSISYNDTDMVITDICSDFIKFISEYLDISCSGGISRRYNSINDIHKAYLEAEEALTRKFYMGHGSINVFSSHGINGILDKKIKAAGSDMQKLIIATDMNGFDSYLNSLVLSIINVGFVSVKETRAFFCGLMFNIVMGINDRNEGSSLPKVESLAYLNDFMENDTITELVSKFKLLVEKLVRFYEDNESRYTNALLNRIKDFVVENISKDISLIMAADHAKVAPQYVSRIFKSKTGIGFNDFVLNEKMKLAKDMLKKDNKLWVIAQKIGYADIASFSRAFKRVEGISPKQYKIRILEV